MKIAAIRSVFVSLLIVALIGGSRLAWGQTDDGKSSEVKEVRVLIDRYAKSIETADVELAAKVWQTTNDVSFIQPRGHQHGWEEVKENFYEKTMGANFTKRKLKVRDVVVHVIGNMAWAEFYWSFDATMAKDATTIHTEGRETQVLEKTNQGWRTVHVHYSGMPVTGERQGF
ncbi:YybH family protein [Novipirellula rosea]|uniref:SnoaL-like domain-containing protein n=1 Tax=Novipirellula rosea TaxID=1031540 RepID=A0ABP8MBI2_9BACT